MTAAELNIPKSFNDGDISHFIKEFPHGICFLDLETTGLSPIGDEIIEIAIIKISPSGQITTFESLIRPKGDIPEKTIDIHGITPEMVKDSPEINDVLPNAIKFIDRSPLVAHNAKFDLGFIIYAAYKLDISLKDIDILCTCFLARRLYRDLPKHSLNALCDEFDIENENHHRALNDTWVCLKLFLKLSRNPKYVRERGVLFNLKEYKNLKDFVVPEHIKNFTNEIFNQVPLLMKYRGGSIRMDYRPIKPTAVMPMPSGPVLYGQCLISNQNKSFGLKKVKELKLPSEQELQNAIDEGKEILEKSQADEQFKKKYKL